MSRKRARSGRDTAAAPSSGPVGILVLGMHRSGTSAITRVLNLLGADLGTRLLPAVEGVNDAGFWEHADAVALNDKLLHWHGRPWHSVQPMPVDAIGADLLAQARTDIGALIERDFADTALWAVKDPRMSLLAPVWTGALQEAGVSPRVLVAVRHPDEVAASLHRRDAITRAHADLLWGTYFIDAVRASAGYPRAISDYADLLADWRGAIARIEDGLGVAWPIAPGQAAPGIDAFLRPEQRRHHAGDTNPAEDDALHASVLALYAVAVDIAAGRAGWGALEPAIERFERIRRQAAPHVQELLDHVWAHADRARQVESRLVRLAATTSDQDAGVDGDGRAARFADAVAAQRRLESTLADVRAHAAALEQAREELRRQLDVAEARVAEKEARLVAVGEQLVRLEAAQAELHGHASALEAAREELRRRAEVAESALHRMQQVVDEKEARLVVVGDAHTRAEAALAELTTHTHALETARDELRGEIGDLRRQLQAGAHLQDIVAEKEARLVVVGDAHRRSDAALADLTRHANALESARDALRGEVESLRLQVQAAAHLQGIVDEKEARLVAARDNAGRADAAMAALQNHAHALEQARGEALSRIQQLEAHLVVATATRPHLEQLLEERKARLGQFSERLSGCEAALRAARAESRALQQALDTAQAAGKDALDAAEAALAAAESRHTQERTALAEAMEMAEARHAEERRQLVGALESADARHAAERQQGAAASLEAEARFERDRRVLEAAVGAAEARHDEARRLLDARSHDLDVIRNSRSWRITAPLRAVLAWMRPGR